MRYQTTRPEPRPTKSPDQAGRSPPGRADGRRREAVPGQGRGSHDNQRDRRGGAGRQGHVLPLLRVQERDADRPGQPLHRPVPGALAERRGRLPAGDWRARLQTWIRVNVEAYVETFRTHDIVYANHHHHDRSNQDKNAILEQLQDIIERGMAAGAWTTDQPRIVALLIYAGVHGATDELIAAQPADCAAFARAVADSCMRMLDAPRPRGQTR